jgi:hypothetical protein
MFNGGNYVSFGWGPRREAIAACAERLTHCLSDLGKLDSAFSSWRCVKESRGIPYSQLNSSIVSRWLAEGVNRTDIGHELIPELGFSLLLVANEEETALPLSIACGMWSPRLSNCCSLDLPCSGNTASRLLNVSTLMQVAKAIIASWEPEGGVITSHECSRLVGAPRYESEAGWITYVSDKCAARAAIPEKATVEPVVGGKLVIATLDRFSTANPKHMAIVRQLSRSLEEAIDGGRRE